MMQRDFEDKLNSMRQKMEQKMEEKISSLARAHQQTALPDEGVRVSTKGSCSAADPSGEQPPTDLPGLCELYIEDDPPRLVVIGRVFEGGSTIHGVPLQPHWTRVVVDQVHDAFAPVLVPTTEVQQVGQAFGTFLAWPRHLVMAPSSRAKVCLFPFALLHSYNFFFV
ncbi:hypothetical protein Fmac_019167 [Flemingia macrophylla]|uniref:DUF8039 domain-containing protein n=1 Tax=Flemingia macrophylla TaxID=520843 RepID=A0ABD1M736_9FABA